MSVGTVLTAISLLKDAAPYLGKLAEKFLNGEITKDELEFKSKSEDLSAEVQLALAQIMLNKEEAKSPHFFVAGWRIRGMVCGLRFLYDNNSIPFTTILLT